jgi:uncharacterized protein YjiS (DUF1127 family)
MNQAQSQTAKPLLANTSSGSVVGHLLRTARATWDRQRQRRALLDLEAHTLRDIGMTREEALNEARKPFWK